MTFSSVVIPVSLGLREFARQINTVQSQLIGLTRPIASVATSLQAAFGSGFQQVLTFFQNLSKGIQQNFQQIIPSVVRFAQQTQAVLIGLRPVFNQVFAAASQGFAALIPVLQQDLARAVQAVQQGLVWMPPFFDLLLPKAIQFGLAFTGALTGIPQVIDKAGLSLQGLFQGTVGLGTRIAKIRKNFFEVNAVILDALIPAARQFLSIYDGTGQLAAIFAPITTNLAALQRGVIAKYTANGGTLLGRYQDYVAVLGITKELVATAKGLTLAKAITIPIEAITRPQKILGLFNQMTASIGQASQQFALFSAEINRINTNILQNATSLASGQGFANIGPLGMPGVAGPSVYDMFDSEQAVQEAIDFELLTKSVRANYAAAGAGVKQWAALNNQILNFGVTTGLTVDQSAELATVIQQQGYSIDEAESAMQSFALTAGATGDAVADIVPVLTALRTAYGLSVDELDQFSDLLVKISLQSGVAISEYGDGLQELAPYANAAGQPLEDLAVLLGTIGAQGGDVGTFAGGLVGIIQTLQEVASGSDYLKNDQFTDILSLIGLSPEDFKSSSGDLKSLIDIFPLIGEGIAKFKTTAGAAEANNVLTALFGEEDAGAASLLINKSTSEIRSLTNGVQGFREAAAADRGGDFTSTLQRIGDAAQVVSIKLGQNLIPIFQALISPVESVVVAFSQLRPSVIGGVVAFNALIPLIVAYFKGVSLAVQAQKLFTAAKLATITTSKVLRGEITLNAIATKIAADATKVWAAAQALAGKGLKVLRGEIALQTVAQKAFAAASTLGSANLKDYLSTTKAANGIILKQVATLGLAFLAFKSIAELFRSSEGAKYAGEINNVAESFLRANPEIATFEEKSRILAGSTIGSGAFSASLVEAGAALDRVGAAFDSVQGSILDFVEAAKQQGVAEATRQSVAALIQGAEGATEYGKQWRFITAEQLGAQRATLALEKTQRLSNVVLDDGFRLLEQYNSGLNPAQAEEYNQALNEQAEVLTQLIDSLKAQVPPTESAKALQQTQIALLEKQLGLVRGRVAGLNSEGEAVKKVALSYEDLVDKYQGLDLQSDLDFGSRAAAIEQDLAEGQIGTAEAERARIELQAEQTATQLEQEGARIQELRAALAGESGSNREQIEDEINNALREQVRLRGETFKTQQQINELEKQTLENNTRAAVDAARQESELQKTLAEIQAVEGALGGSVSADEVDSLKQQASITALQDADKIRQLELDGLQQLQDKGLIETEEYERRMGEIQQSAASDRLSLLEIQLKQEEDVRRASQERIIKDLEDSIARQQSIGALEQQALEFQGTRTGFESSKVGLESQIAAEITRGKQEQLEYELKIAEAAENTTAAEQIKSQIQQLQIGSIRQQAEFRQKELDISIRQTEIELKRKEIQEQLAVAEAQVNLEKLKATEASTAEIEAAQNRLLLQQQKLSFISEERAAVGELNALEQQKLDLETQNNLAAAQRKEITAQNKEEALQTVEITAQNKEEALQTVEIIKTQTLEYEQQAAALENNLSLISQQSELLSAQQSLAEAYEQSEVSKLESQLKLAEASGDALKAEQLKAAIYLEQRDQIQAATDRQRESLELSQQQKKIELEKQEIAAKSALFEASSALEKGRAESATAGEIAALQQAVQIKSEEFRIAQSSKQINAEIERLKQKQLSVENQTKLENLDVERSLDRQRMATEEVKEATSGVNTELEKIKQQADAVAASFKNQETQINLAKNALSIQSDFLSSQGGLQEALAAEAQAEINLDIKKAESQGDTDKAERLKVEAYGQQIEALLQAQEIEAENLKIKQQQIELELYLAKLKQRQAILEAQANIERRKGEGASATEIAQLQAALGLEQQALGILEAQSAFRDEINQMDAEALAARQNTARLNLEAQGIAVPDSEGNVSDLQKRMERESRALRQAPEFDANTADLTTPPAAITEAANRDNLLQIALDTLNQAIANGQLNKVENLTVVSNNPTQDSAAIINDLTQTYR